MDIEKLESTSNISSEDDNDLAQKALPLDTSNTDSEMDEAVKYLLSVREETQRVDKIGYKKSE